MFEMTNIYINGTLSGVTQSGEICLPLLKFCFTTEGKGWILGCRHSSNCTCMAPITNLVSWWLAYPANYYTNTRVFQVGLSGDASSPRTAHRSPGGSARQYHQPSTRAARRRQVRNRDLALDHVVPECTSRDGKMNTVRIETSRNVEDVRMAHGIVHNHN